MKAELYRCDSDSQRRISSSFPTVTVRLVPRMSSSMWTPSPRCEVQLQYCTEVDS